MWVVTITRVLLLAVSSVAVAGKPVKTVPVFATGDVLRAWCLGKGAVRASCTGYLAGVVDSIRVRGGSGPDSVRACLPPKLSPEQVRLLFLNHAHRHSDRRVHAAAALVEEALSAAFPCAPPATPTSPGRGGERISVAPQSTPGYLLRVSKIVTGP